MAVTTTIKSLGVRMRLNNGVDASGNVKTVTTSIGTLNKNAYDAQKVMNIVALATPCLAKVLYSVEKSETDTLTASE